MRWWYEQYRKISCSSFSSLFIERKFFLHSHTLGRIDCKKNCLAAMYFLLILLFYCVVITIHRHVCSKSALTRIDKKTSVEIGDVIFSRINVIVIIIVILLLFLLLTSLSHVSFLFFLYKEKQNNDSYCLNVGSMYSFLYYLSKILLCIHITQ